MSKKIHKHTSFAGAMGTVGRDWVVLVRVTILVPVLIPLEIATLLTGTKVASFFAVTKK